MSLPLANGQKIAAKIVAELSPFCERIEIAGSIRRRRPFVNDIDLVCIPSNQAALRARCLEKCRLITDGNQNFIVAMPNSVQLDIWMAQPGTRDLLESKPSNFGSLLLCRTGSKEHNIWLVGQAQRLGLRWNPYWGVFDGHGKCLASATEEEIFAALKLDYIPPEKRERS